MALFLRYYWRVQWRPCPISSPPDSAFCRDPRARPAARAIFPKTGFRHVPLCVFDEMFHRDPPRHTSTPRRPRFLISVYFLMKDGIGGGEPVDHRRDRRGCPGAYRCRNLHLADVRQREAAACPSGWTFWPCAIGGRFFDRAGVDGRCCPSRVSGKLRQWGMVMVRSARAQGGGRRASSTGSGGRLCGGHDHTDFRGGVLMGELVRCPRPSPQGLVAWPSPTWRAATARTPMSVRQRCGPGYRFYFGRDVALDIQLVYARWYGGPNAWRSRLQARAR